MTPDSRECGTLGRVPEDRRDAYPALYGDTRAPGLWDACSGTCSASLCAALAGGVMRSYRAICARLYGAGCHHVAFGRVVLRRERPASSRILLGGSVAVEDRRRDRRERSSRAD